MLWLFNNQKNYTFYQIFNDFKLVNIESNHIYSFDSSENVDLEDSKQKNIIKEFLNSNDISQYTNIKISYQIKILDQLIQYYNIQTDKTIVFSHKTNFINPENNHFNLPIFKSEYKLVNNTRMPNLIELNYNVQTQLDFIIYKINENILLVIETNPITNLQKKYFITTDLDFCKKFITNN